MPALATSLVCKNIAASTWTGARAPCCICPTIFLAHHSISNGTVPSFQCTSLLECFFWARRPRSCGLRQEAPDWTVVARVQRFQLCLQKSALYSCRGREAAQHKNDCVDEVAFELELHWGSLQAAHHAPSIPGGSDPRSSLMREGRVPWAPTPKVLEDRFGYTSEVPLIFSLASFSTQCTDRAPVAPGHDGIFLFPQILHNADVCHCPVDLTMLKSWLCARMTVSSATRTAALLERGFSQLGDSSSPSPSAVVVLCTVFIRTKLSLRFGERRRTCWPVSTL